MKKATPKPAAVTTNNLGTKRTCPKCATKFYDFNKEVITCPKCSAKVDPDALNPLANIPAEIKKPVKEKAPEAAAATGDEIVVDDAEVLESVDDLGSEDEDLVEDIDVEDDEEEQESF